MPKIKTIKITSWVGGIGDDVREQTGRFFATSKHFDIHASPKRLIPHRSMESDSTTVSGTSSAVTEFRISDYGYALSKLYGYGQVDSTDAKPRIMVKDTSTITGDWAFAATSYNASSSDKQSGCFTYYNYYWYGFNGTLNIHRYGSIITGAAVFDYNWQTTAAFINSVAQGIVGINDKLYLPYNARLAEWDGTTFSNNIINFPVDLQITALANYNNHLAIACKPRTEVGRSRIYIWDFNSDDPSDSIDFGEGALEILGEVGGSLIAVSQVGGGTNTSIEPRMIVRAYEGGKPKIIKNISLVDANGVSHSIESQPTISHGERISFHVTGAGQYGGIWSIGRVTDRHPLSMTVENTILQTSSNPTVDGFYWAGDYLFVSHSGDGSILRTNDAINHSYTSVLETEVYGDGETDNQLIGAKVMFAPLKKLDAADTDASVTLKYRVNGATDWTTIASVTESSLAPTNPKLLLEASNEVPLGKNFKDWREIQFKVESVGGAEITGLKFRYLEKETNI